MEKVVFDNFFHFFHEVFIKMVEKVVSEIRGKMVEKVVKNNFFHDSSRSGGPNRGKSCF